MTTKLPPLPEPCTSALVEGFQGAEYRSLSLDYETGTARFSEDQLQSYATAHGEAIEARHAEELLAAQITIDNLRAGTPPAPAWQDAPTVPGLWAYMTSWGGTGAQAVSAREISQKVFESVDRRYFGPILGVEIPT